jgi:hypothetical protein
MGLCGVGVFYGPIGGLIQQHKKGRTAGGSQLGPDRSLAAGGSLGTQG